MKPDALPDLQVQDHTPGWYYGAGSRTAHYYGSDGRSACGRLLRAGGIRLTVPPAMMECEDCARAIEGQHGGELRRLAFWAALAGAAAGIVLGKLVRWL